jgi:hypothetical protein
MVEGPDEPTLTPAVPNTVTCAGCGVAVAVGYPRCPRCHATVPQPPRARRVTSRDPVGSGTTAAPEADGPPIGWIVAGIVGVVGVGLAIWLVGRDPPRRAAGAVDEADEADDEAEDVDAGEEPTGTARTPPGGRRAEPGGIGPTVRALDEALREQNLWGKLAVAGDVVVIESQQCEDPSLWPLVVGEAPALLEVGITAVRCEAPHGGVVFERPLP